MNKFLTEVNDLCRTVDHNIVRVNSGGCAVFAAFMGQCLEKYGTVTIAVGNDESATRSLDVLRTNIDVNVLEEWSDNDVYLTHVIIEFTYKGVKYHIDSTGVHKPRLTTYSGDFWILDGRLSVSEITSLASDTSWNHQFDRKQIPKIKKMINTGFKNLFNRGFMPTVG